ncbi:YbhB/YbcL family Raf kinase inhibitor-like protein [Halogranum rubrum]|uniref:YbhB/YbcL family Raf kinase inhibitor-like protein n=1 Tax=Halogranum rubrum TaxID=553466 RepID=UPI0009FC7923|nr:YbhB/YbcL family Raf kinase inhibitor-like protein [Halogranum salarium]
MPSRRQLLVTTTSLALATVAGCSESSPQTSSPADSPTATKPTETTRTATGTPTSTENARSTTSPQTTATAETTETPQNATQTNDPSPTPSGAFSLSSPSFEDGGPIPETFTCDGQNVSPALDIADPPSATEAFALVVDDPDAPRSDPFVHWLLWNVPGDTRRIPVNVPQTETVEGLGGARQGTNDAGSVGYTGPCPPVGDSPHRYRLVLYALDSTLSVEAGATRDDLSGSLAERQLDTTTLVGTYARQQGQ